MHLVDDRNRPQSEQHATRSEHEKTIRRGRELADVPPVDKFSSEYAQNHPERAAGKIALRIKTPALRGG
jgi:hypothetical protein